MAIISAEEGALKAGADAVRDARAAVKSRATEVRNEVQSVSYWKGAAANSFQGLMTEWDSKAEGLLKVLDQLEENLRGTEKDQAAQEEEGTSTVSSLQAGMSGI
jgi:WXG100 family type VII secretion target